MFIPIKWQKITVKKPKKLYLAMSKTYVKVYSEILSVLTKVIVPYDELNLNRKGYYRKIK